MKKFSTIIVEGSSSGSGWGVFGFFTSLFVDDSNEAKARKKAREEDAKEKKKWEDLAKKELDKTKAEAITAAANFKRNQYSLKMKQKVDAIKKRAAKLKKLGEIYKNNKILHGENATAFIQNQINRAKSGLMPNEISDFEAAQAEFTTLIFKKDDSGNIVLKNQNELNEALNGLTGENSPSPVLRDMLGKHGLIDKDGKIKTPSAEEYNSFAKSMASDAVDYDGAQESLNDANDDLSKKTVDREEYKKNQEEYKKRVAAQEALNNYNNNSDTPIDVQAKDLIKTENDTGSKKGWGELDTNVKEKLLNAGINQSMYDNMPQDAKIPDYFNSDEVKGQRKEVLKATLDEKLAETSINWSGDNYDDLDKDKGPLNKEELANSDPDKQNKYQDVKDGEWENTEKKLKDAVTAAEKKVGEVADHKEQLKQTFEEAERVKKDLKAQQNSEVKEIVNQIRKESFNGGECRNNDGKYGYWEEKKFIERPNPDASEEEVEKYNNALKLRTMQGLDGEGNPVKEIDYTVTATVDDNGNVKYIKKDDKGNTTEVNKDNYKEYLRAKKAEEAYDAQTEVIKSEIAAAVNADNPTEYQKQLVQNLVKVSKEENLTPDQKNYIAACKGKLKKEDAQKFGINSTEDFEHLISAADGPSKPSAPKGASNPTGDEDSDYGEDEAEHDEGDDDGDYNTYKDESGNELVNPAKIWHRRKKKTGEGMTKSYFNKEGDKISQEDFKNRLASYRKAREKNAGAGAIDNNSLFTSYLKNKLIMS